MNLDLVNQKAEEIAEKYNAEKVAPFPFKNIEEKHSDLKIYLTEMEEGVSGAIVYDDDKCHFDVLINKNKPKKRQYFTIAHELGHYFLHRDQIQKNKIMVDSDDVVSEESMLYRLDNAPSTQIEVEANRFAASLLMPEKLVKKAWELMQNVQECADLFQVSISAMSIRLENLKLINSDQ